MDSILGYHMNPLTCGVARFNRALADMMDLKVYNVFSRDGQRTQSPLFSFKASEMSPEALLRLESLAKNPDIWPGLRLFFHDYTDTPVERLLVDRSVKVYCGNDVLAERIRPRHRDVVTAWCPGYLFETREFDQKAEISIYTFGMAHKLRTDYFYRLHELLEKTGKRYVIYISAAIHEDTSLDDSFTAAYLELRKIFAEKIFFLGFVSDSALFAFLRTCTYFAAFFQSGVRANNSSVSTAMQAGAAVLTNLDDGSPVEFEHMKTVVDILQCKDGLPLDPGKLAEIAEAGRETANKFGWPPLLQLIRSEEAKVAAPMRRS